MRGLDVTNLIRDFDKTLEELAMLAEREGYIHMAERIRWRKEDYFLGVDDKVMDDYKKGLETDRMIDESRDESLRMEI